MSALMQFGRTLPLRGDRLISQGSQHRKGTGGAFPRITCSKPTTTGIDSAAEVKSRESRAKREAPQLSRLRAVKAAAAKTQTKPEQRESAEESDWDVYWDILPDSCDCRILAHLRASWRCEMNVESSELTIAGSKKPLRLASSSWDLLD